MESSNKGLIGDDQAIKAFFGDHQAIKVFFGGDQAIKISSERQCINYQILFSASSCTIVALIHHAFLTILGTHPWTPPPDTLKTSDQELLQTHDQGLFLETIKQSRPIFTDQDS